MNSIEYQLEAEELLIIYLIRKDYDTARNLLEKKRIKISLLNSLLQRHRTSYVIYKRIIAHLSEFMPENFIMGCKIAILQQMNYNRERRAELKKLAQLIMNAGYPIMTIKGFIFEDLTDGPRIFSDIDLLINENDLWSIITILEDNGYTYHGPAGVLSQKERTEINGQLAWNNQYPFKCSNMDFNFEIHTNLFERDRIRYEKLDTLLNNINLFWDKKIWNDSYSCYGPCQESTLALLCLHISLKRSLASRNPHYLLRHVIDMDAILNQEVNIDYFIYLCKKWQISYHAFFAISLHEKIMGMKTKYTPHLASLLSKPELLLSHIHLSCWKNLSGNKKNFVFLYNLLMPFIIGGGISKSIRWYLYVMFPTLVQQEHVYGKYGFKKESPTIYLTYLLNPFRSFYNSITRK